MSGVNDTFSVYLPVILGSTISTIVTFIVIAVQKSSKVSSNVLTGTVKIEGLENQINDIKKTMVDAIDEMESKFEKRGDMFQKEWNRIWERMEKMSNAINLHEYRLDELQRRRNGGDKSAI